MNKAWVRLMGLGMRWPSRCAVCRHWTSAPLCETCIARFAQPQPRCLGCALPLQGGALRCGHCLRQPPPLQICLTAVDYGWPWRELITRFKFQEQTAWARPLAWLMLGSVGAQDALLRADLVLPIPLSRQRLAARGYNQSWLLARCLAPAQADAGLLLRTRDTPAQRTLPRAQRLANLVGAFAVDPLRAPEVRGRRLLLVDDVMTSGASLHTAAQVLLQAGAAEVGALVLARTGLQDDDRTDDSR